MHADSAEHVSAGADPGAAQETAPRQPASLTMLLGCARAHGEITETRTWVDDLERLLTAAWELMNAEQRDALLQHPEALAVFEASGYAETSA